jgi:hypothetical protein
MAGACLAAAQQNDRARTEAMARRAGERLQMLQREADRLASDERSLLNELRKLDVDRSLPYARVFKHAEWLQHMYRLHVFDHPERSDVETPRAVEIAPNPYLQ